MRKRFTRRALYAVFATTILLPKHLEAEIGPKRPISPAEIWSRTELFFGSSRPNGTVVDDAEFAKFVDEEVTRRFPDGLTLLTGYGQFKNSAGTIIREKSFVLILFYPAQTIDANKKIQEIREAYKVANSQESVLRADNYSIISF